MFISNEALVFALKDLEGLHPFFGITYLVCKRDKLPTGDPIEYPINARETAFLNEFFKPIQGTTKFFRAFRTSEKSKYWLNDDYASSGSQATRTQMFSEAFIHPKGTNLWAWSDNYVDTLSAHLKKKRIPAFSLAFWILKQKPLTKRVTSKEILDIFFTDFFISKNEISSLFNTEVPEWLKKANPFGIDLYSWDELADRLNIPAPPDAPVLKGGALKSLELKDIGPSKKLTLDLSSRLNIITGDNGLGKSFILEAAWWALTSKWTGFPLYPNEALRNEKPEISFTISSKANAGDQYKASFDWRMQDWFINKKTKQTVPGLVIYAKVDGAFAIWDPTRMQVGKEDISIPTFSREDIWNGVRLNDGNRARSIFNGLITDWVHWQTTNAEAFEILKKVLRRLSPPDLRRGDLGLLEPGEIVRIPGESRPMPTIKHPYGQVPIISASAAVKRIIALSYLIVWTWEEHKTAVGLMRESPQRKMVVIADEIESHLHPQWQRVILPALASVSTDLSNDLETQFIITTHSPLVMASLEPIYDDASDKIFHLNLHTQKDGSASVILETPIFERRGSADSWLISNVFDLKQPRSIEAEETIEKAKLLLAEKSESKQKIMEVNDKLHELLPSHDTFWIRWNYFVEKHAGQA